MRSLRYAFGVSSRSATRPFDRPAGVSQPIILDGDPGNDDVPVVDAVGRFA